MKIAVNTRLLLHNKLEGIGRFSFETLKRITKNHPEHQFIFFFDRPWHKEFIFSDNITPVALFPQSRHPFLWYLWFEFSVAAALKKYNADVFLSPDGYLSLSTDVPQIPVIHDLNFEHYPQDLPFLYSKYYRHYFPKYAHKAARIATVSEFSKNDIVLQYGIDAAQIDVVYNGCNENFKPVSAEVKEQTKIKFSKACPYLVYVGAQHQRKNLQNLFRAFDEYKKEGSNYKLLISGQKKWWTSEMEDAFAGMQYKDDVVFTGRLSEEDLVNVLASSEALVYVSYFEGFGIPVVEAMRCNVPVICANSTSLPEVAGRAALLVNPFAVSEIAVAMKKVTTDEQLRNRLTQEGQEQSKQFTWDATAQKLWQCIEKAVN
ncbi:MAG: D-inositol-3-phosphate glycosyltransferase [Bacteroidia bacterium]|nr:D-inositol-3-phosphate glycosyltransferase [Bacteroidia bacterium]